MKSTVNKIILYDGLCNLCNNTVRFIKRHDKKKKFRFVAFQTEEGKRIIESKNIKLSGIVPDTIYYFENEKIYIKSTAIIKICSHLGGLWKFFLTLLIIPESYRNKLYSFISRNRYRFFGVTDACSTK
jgi:predicted DCC family thiol-disulfide oxidoreductase YuxK